MVLRRIFGVAVIAIAATVPAFSGGAANAAPRGGGCSMDMDAGHGHGASGCGGHGKNAQVVKGARKIAVEATSFAFSPTDISVAAGENVTIVLHSSDVMHDLVVKGEGHVVSAKANKTAKGGLRIDKPGTYRFWCSVSGHRAAGMRGTIIVT